MHICTAGMLRLHTPSTHIPPSHLRGTLFSCPQRHTPGLETWEMWGQPKAETQEIPQQKPCHMPKPRPLSGQGSEDREDWGGSLGVGKVLPAGELVLAVGFALTPLPQGCQGAEALALALGALALQAPLLQVSPGRGGGGEVRRLPELYLSVAVWPKASCPLIRVLIREMAWRKSQDSWSLCPGACTCTHFCNVQTFATFCRGLGLPPPASQERGRMQLSKTLPSAHLPPPSQCPETLSLFSPHHFSPFLCPQCVGGQEGRT